MWKFIRYELKYWIKTPMIWIFMFIYALFTFFATASDNVVIGGVAGSMFKNAPYQIQNYYEIMSIVCLLMTTAFMNATANRDFEYDMHAFIFSSPIKKRDYFFGKFIGAAIISVVPAIGISIGALLAPLLAPIFDMAPAERFGEIYWSAHLFGLIDFAIPNVIISGVLIFALAILFRNSIVSFVGSMLMLVLYIVSSSYSDNIHTEWLANLVDPFGVRPYDTLTKYFTADEKNHTVVTLTGDLLMNRLFWLAISLLILLLIYRRFSFNTKNEKTVKAVKAKKVEVAPVLSQHVFLPTSAGKFSFKTLWALIKIESKAVIKNPVYVSLMLIGLILLIVNFTELEDHFGTKRYPVTYLMVDNIVDAYTMFMYGFIAFYTGMLVWKERDAKINEIQDATPARTSMLFISKVIAIMNSIALVYLLAIALAIIAQTLNGYTHYELGVYVKSLLVIRMIKLSFLVILSLLFHYLINNRYIAWFSFIAFTIVNSFIWSLLEINSNMLAFGHMPDIKYSDMNGFGPFVPGIIGFSIYWGLFCLLLCLIIIGFYTRGKEEQISQRWQNARLYLKRHGVLSAAALLLFGLCAGYVYYNTKVLNTYETSKDYENKSVSYEKKYKQYENLAQPRFYKFDYTIDLYPEQRGMQIQAVAWAKNRTQQTISTLHLTLPDISKDYSVKIDGAKLKSNDQELNYQIYEFNQPLQPNDSVKMVIAFKKESPGFENEVSFTKLTQNGTFFNNADFMPSIGYNRNMEISNKNKRAKLKLPVRARMAKLDENNLKARGNTYISSDSDWVDVRTTISTSANQIAVAPGSLIKSWSQNNRKYFTYQLDHQSLNFYSFISAQYQVAKRTWNGISLEVYYDAAHSYNVENMLKSMQRSLEYYTKNFGPYRHKQCRIIEFPRYESFAQAFPGTMPYSESIGFITDLREVDQNAVDMVFYVVAHEMGHQYWAHQVCGADMQGSEMMSEGFAQYSALMVMEKEYGRDKMKKFLEYEMDDYLNGRSSESEAENPIMKTEDQQYIHYNKASVVLYYLKEMIGEKQVNEALKNLIAKYGYQKPPFPTSIDAVNEFKKVTPPHLQYLIADLFENITLFSNRMLEASSKKTNQGYEVTLKVSCEKFRANAKGKETKIQVADYIDIGIFAEPTDDKNLGKPLVYKRVKITKKDNSFTFITKEKPYQAGIDPYNYIIDRVPDDNVKKVDN
ncbi:MAG: hypothetical protein JST78_04845 [Bacteroidetes bacterium]|nr:hypothetical protein [Bacteroidota bacterium]